MKKLFLFIVIITVFLIDQYFLHADDTDIFVINEPPDVLILLDMSGSMNWAPSGGQASYPNRRIDIAREVLKGLLDYNNDGNINEQDEEGLNVRFGYMRFRLAYNNDDGDPKTGRIRVLSEIGSPYKNIWDKINDPNETARGGTPLAAALGEAKTYFLRDVNPLDPAIACRKKFVILISDGADTYGCNGNGGDPNCKENEEQINPGMKRRRMLTVQKAKELNDAGIKVYVVGLGGGMPECLTRTLNWAAYYGGTDNLLENNFGDPTKYDIKKYGESCSIDPSNVNADPANYPLSGFAFIAEDASQLSIALKTILGEITSNNYNFTSPTVPSIRIQSDDYMYLASFRPNESPFWPGFLKAYKIKIDGTIDPNTIWDAGEELDKKYHDSRKIYTFLRGAMQEFTSGNISKEDLGVENDASRDTIIKYVRGNTEDFQDTWDIDRDSNDTEPRPYKLGDIFHSNPVIVGSPSRFFKDEGYSGPGGFYDFNKKRTKVVITGANDGMLHAFNAGDWDDSLNGGLGGHNTGSGEEEWAFIPPSILKKLQSMTSQHTYYVDSSPKVADVWFYSSPSDNTKSKDEWKTVLVCGLRKGGKHYFALDITDTKNPKFLWEFPFPNDNSTLEKLGESWSEPAIGRIKLGEFEKWVAIIGGGFDPNENRKNFNSHATIGKGLFVVDIKTGEIIKEISGLNDMNYSFPSPPTAVDINLDGFIDKVYIGDLGGQMWVFDISSDNKDKWNGKRLFAGNPGEKHPIYYQPAVAFDPNKIPWVFFGTGDRENPKDTTNPPERFYGVKDDGQGSYPRREENLKDLIGLVENTFTKVTDPYKGWFIKLEKTEGKHEKVLAKPSVFNRLLYFTTYSYKQTNDPCQVKGDAKLYIVEYLSGGGALEVEKYTDLLGPTSAERSEVIGEGIPSPPVISINTEGKASVVVVTTDGQIFRRKAFSDLKIQDLLLYWREVVR